MATRPRTRPDWGKAFEKFASGVAVFFLGLWWLMLLFGVLHHDFSSAVPAYGFWELAIPFLLLDMVVNSLMYNAPVKTRDSG